MKIDSLKLKGLYVFENIQRVVNSKVLEKGNSLVFSLDKAMRELRFFQDHVGNFEKELKEAIRMEFSNILTDNKSEMGNKEKKLHDMHQNIMNVMNDHIVNEEKRIKTHIHKRLVDMKLSKHDLDEANFEISDYRKAKMEEPQKKLTSSSLGGPMGRMSTNQSNQGSRTVLDQPLISSEDSMKIVMLLQSKMIKQRTLWDLRHVSTVKKYEEKIADLEKRLS